MTLTTRTAFLALLAGGALALPAAAEELKFMAELSSEAEVPPVGTEGEGLADITVDTEAMTITWSVAFHGLTGMPVAAHLHGPAEEDETAPPVIDLTADMDEGQASATATASDTDTAGEESVAVDILGGSSELTEEGLQQLRDGLWYVNIHTEQHPQGEIRGQVVEGEADMGAMEAMEAMDGDAMEGGDAEAMEEESEDGEAGGDAEAMEESEGDMEAEAGTAAGEEADAADADAAAGDAGDAEAMEGEDGEETEGN